MRWLERHLGRVRECLDGLPDRRTGRNRMYSMGDIGMAALSVFLMQSESFLAHQRSLAAQRGNSNLRTLFGLSRAPCDNHVRQTLDGVPPESFDGLLGGLAKELDAAGGIEPLRVLRGHVLIALDGTEYFRSRAIECANCSSRRRADGGVEHFHQMLAATIVSPRRNLALPLPPEFLARREGNDRQDCEREAAKRWLARLGPAFAPLRPVYLADGLHACQPICQAVLDAGGHFIMTAKPGSLGTLYDHLRGLRPNTRRTTTGRGARRRVHRCRWMGHLPIRDTDDALRVNWFEIEIAKPDGEVTYRNAFVTDLDVNRDSIGELAECARARWKIENEGFNVLKQHGYHLEHNFGHGKSTLAAVLVSLNLLAFALHTACDLMEALWQRARRRLGSRVRMFEHLRTITCYQVFPSWDSLVSLLATGLPPPQPP